MAVDEAQERRQQLPLFFQFARADSCGDHLGVAARQPNGALKFLVLPFRFGLRLAADAEKCAAALAANVGFLLDECRVQPGPLPRRDLNQLHRCPLSLLESMISKYNKKHCLDSKIGPRLGTARLDPNKDAICPLVRRVGLIIGEVTRQLSAKFLRRVMPGPGPSPGRLLCRGSTIATPIHERRTWPGHGLYLGHDAAG